MLTCNGLKKSYKGKVIVDNLGFKVQKGEVFALLGGNGAGKTTTIKMILNLITVDSGTITKKEGITTGYSPETPYFHRFLSGKEVLMFYGKLQKIPNEKLKIEVSELLDLVGLESGGVKVKNYSKGMLQRLALAQALLGDPDLLILDEPTSGLDAIGRIEMIKTILDLKNRGKTILINSHILNDIESICNRGIILKKGKLIYNWDNEKKQNNRSLEEIFVETVGGHSDDNNY